MSDDMKRDVEKLKSDVAELRGTDKRIAVGLIRLEEKMDHIAERILSGVKRELGGMKGQLDDFTAEVQSSRRERALQDEHFWSLKSRLDNHESRLDGIERGGKS